MLIIFLRLYMSLPSRKCFRCLYLFTIFQCNFTHSLCPRTQSAKITGFHCIGLIAFQGIPQLAIFKQISQQKDGFDLSFASSAHWEGPNEKKLNLFFSQNHLNRLNLNWLFLPFWSFALRIGLMHSRGACGASNSQEPGWAAMPAIIQEEKVGM